MPAFFRLCGLGQVCDCYALASFGNVEISAFGNVDVANKFIVDGDALGAVLSGTFCFVNFDSLYQFSQKGCCQMIQIHKLSDCSKEQILVSLHPLYQKILLPAKVWARSLPSV